MGPVKSIMRNDIRVMRIDNQGVLCKGLYDYDYDYDEYDYDNYDITDQDEKTSYW